MARSQDLEPFYHDAGQFYIYRVQAFLEGNGKVREKVTPYILSEIDVQDIDNIEDWEIAEMKYRIIHKIL